MDGAPKKSFHSNLESLDPISGVDRCGPVMDGPNDRLFGRAQRVQSPGNVSAIFVHAGAGYHSTTNEHIHLGACNEYAEST